MAVTANSMFLGVPLVRVMVGGQEALLPDLSSFKIPLLEDGEEFMVLDESTGEEERDFDTLALECKLNEAEWWRMALANFEECPNPLEVPASVEIIGPRFERERSLGDPALVADDGA